MRHLGFLSLAALLGVTLFNTLIYQAGRSTSATNMAMIAAASPVMIALFDLVGGRRGGREKLGARRTAGMAIALLGVVTLVGKGSPAALWQLDFAMRRPVDARRDRRVHAATAPCCAAAPRGSTSSPSSS